MKLAPITKMLVKAEGFKHKTKAKTLFENYLNWQQQQKKVIMWAAVPIGDDLLYIIVLWNDKKNINQIKVAERLAFLLAYDNVINRQEKNTYICLRVDEFNHYIAKIWKATGRVEVLEYTGISRELDNADAKKALADMVINFI